MNDNPTPGHNVAPDGKPWPSQLAHLVTSTVGRATPPTPAGAEELAAALLRVIVEEIGGYEASHSALSGACAAVHARCIIEVARHFQALREELARVKKELFAEKAARENWGSVASETGKERITSNALRVDLETAKQGFGLIACKLWKLLDDIDTQDDISKSDDLHFRKQVYYIQKKRFDILSGDQFDKLKP